MTLTKEDKVLLKILVEKELKALQEDAKRLMISNSPFLNKEARDEADLPYLKNTNLYKEFLQELSKKL